MSKYSFCVFFCALLLPLIDSHDMIDLVCSTNDDCSNYRSSTINSTCIEAECQCSLAATGAKTDCEPTVTKVSNQIGGQCPCITENSFCNEKTQLCVCKEGFLPSRGGKKCIDMSVELGKPCEIDEQCISSDHFSHCDDTHHNCTCLNNFVIYQNTCHSIIASGETPCTNDTVCSSRAPNSVCHEKQCICGKGFVVNAANTTCLAVARFEQPCEDSNQCISQLGVGSICSEGKCVCNESHFPFAVHSQENATTEPNNVVVVCKRKITHGVSCNEDKDCYQFHVGPHEQTMECFMNECVCTKGYFEKEGVCVSMSGAAELNVSRVMVFLLVTFILCLK